MRRSASALAVLCCVVLAACGGGERSATATSSSASTPTATPPSVAAVEALDSWQKPLLRTVRARNRHQTARPNPVTDYSRRARVAAADIHDDDLAAAVKRSGDSWSAWVDAVHDSNGEAGGEGLLFLQAIADYVAAYRAAGSEPPAAFVLD